MKQNPAKYALPIVFITFRTKKIAGLVEQTWGFKFNFSLKSITKIFDSNKYYSYINGYDSNGNPIKAQTQIRLVVAPNPNDLVWPYLGVGFMQAFQRRFLTFLATAFLLGLSFGAVLGLKVLQFSMNQNQTSQDLLSASSLKFRIVSVCITLVIMIINRALSMGIRTLTLTEMHSTKTQFFQSLTIKVVVVNCVDSVSILEHQLTRGVGAYGGFLA